MSDIAEKLRAALELMNDNGKHWTKGSYRSYDYETGDYFYCSVGAVRNVVMNAADVYAGTGDRCLEALNKQLPEKARQLFDQPWKNIICWNDDKDRTWEEVVDLFTRAADAS